MILTYLIFAIWYYLYFFLENKDIWYYRILNFYIIRKWYKNIWGICSVRYIFAWNLIKIHGKMNVIPFDYHCISSKKDQKLNFLQGYPLTKSSIFVHFWWNVMIIKWNDFWFWANSIKNASYARIFWGYARALRTRIAPRHPAKIYRTEHIPQIFLYKYLVSYHLWAATPER